MPSRGGADGGAPSHRPAGGGRSGGGSASCCPSDGAGAPMTDGVSANLISGPICCVAPAAGSSISTTPSLCSTTGWSIACCVLMILSAATPLLLEHLQPLAGGLGEHRRDYHAVQVGLGRRGPSTRRARRRSGGRRRCGLRAHGRDPEREEAGGHVRHLEPLPVLAADNHVGEVDRAGARRARRLRGRSEHTLVDLPPHRAEHVVGGDRAIHARLEVLPEPAALPRDQRGGDGLEEGVDSWPTRHWGALAAPARHGPPRSGT